MGIERIAASVDDLLCYGAEPEFSQHLTPAEWLRVVDASINSFAHVLNVRPSEEGWLADATELFLPEYFAKRYVSASAYYRQHGAIPDHMRDELYRLSCSPEQVTRESMWLAQHMLYCYEQDGSFAECLFSDGSVDEYDVEDSLDSELLLTEVYHAPDSVSKMRKYPSLSTECPMRANPSTEQED